MSGLYLTFWIVLGAIGFAFVLAVQMRGVIGMALKRALQAKFTDLEIADQRKAVVDAGNLSGASPASLHLIDTYPNQLSQLRLARLVSKIAPFLLVIVLVVGRWYMGAI
jgi:hypothetical protein